jgi:short-subunit dehydrogenase
MRNPRAILITGGSSGLGEGLALAYAAPGVFLAISGRNEERLASVAQACREKGAEVEAENVNVGDADSMRRWIERVDGAHALDLVVANAGIGAGTGRGGEPAAQVREVFAINVDGVFNTILPAAERMRTRRRGQIAIMSSLAGFRGFSGAPAYSASKAAVKVYGEALRGDLAAAGIEVSVICPGFVKSRMTARNKFPMPFLMETGRAVRIIQRGLAANRSRIAFPLPLYMAVWLIASLPPRLTDLFVRRLPKKE